MIAAAFLAVATIVPGIMLLVQLETGTPASATVDDCVTTGVGRYASTHCTGTWTVGGSLLEGGHVIVGTISGADKSDVGKTIAVTLHGDEAYSRSLALPLLLIGLGLTPAALAIVFGVKLRNAPQARTDDVP